MNDERTKIITERLKKSLGKRCEIHLENGFRYSGIISNCDETWLELLEFKIQGYKLVKVEDIADIEIKGEEKK